MSWKSWKLVPLKPTSIMLDAASWHFNYEDMWQAMLEAAPERDDMNEPLKTVPGVTLNVWWDKRTLGHYPIDNPYAIIQLATENKGFAWAHLDRAEVLELRKLLDQLLKEKP